MASVTYPPEMLPRADRDDDVGVIVCSGVCKRFEWQPIETAPKDEMFIWAAPKGKGKWSLGLAYRNVSGGWSDAYGSDAPDRATQWMPLPEPPKP